MVAGFCMCGCGQLTTIATRSATCYGWVKGQPMRYIKGHALNEARLKRLNTPKQPPTADQRRESYVAYIRARVRVDEATGCWLWTAAISQRHGYAKFRNLNRSTTGHRASYEAFVGPIPAGMCVCHACDVRHCVNPDHLFLGTNKDNTQDMLRKGRRPSRYRVKKIGSGTE